MKLYEKLYIFMYYVYVLFSRKDNGSYIRYTKDLKRRFTEHNNGYSVSTKDRAPFLLIYYEPFINNSDALSRDKYLKSGYSRKQLSMILQRTFRKLDI